MGIDVFNVILRSKDTNCLILKQYLNYLAVKIASVNKSANIFPPASEK